MVYYRFGPFVLDPASRLLIREEQSVPITTKVFETLVVLVENRGRVITKDELLLRLWPDTTVEEANLAQNISTLRKALEDNPKNHRYIATIPGRGYCFVAPVHTVHPSTPAQDSQWAGSLLSPSDPERETAITGAATHRYPETHIPPPDGRHETDRLTTGELKTRLPAHPSRRWQVAL